MIQVFRRSFLKTFLKSFRRTQFLLLLTVLIFLTLSSTESFALNRYPLIEMSCRSSSGERVEVLVDAKMNIGLAWMDEAQGILNRGGSLIYDDLYKVYLFDFGESRFRIEENFLSGKGSKSLAKLSLEKELGDRTLNLICEVTKDFGTP